MSHYKEAFGKVKLKIGDQALHGRRLRSFHKCDTIHLCRIGTSGGENLFRRGRREVEYYLSTLQKNASWGVCEGLVFALWFSDGKSTDRKNLKVAHGQQKNADCRGQMKK